MHTNDFGFLAALHSLRELRATEVHRRALSAASALTGLTALVIGEHRPAGMSLRLLSVAC